MQFFVTKNTQEFKNKQSLIERIENELRTFLTALIESILQEEMKVFLNRGRYERRDEKDIRLYRNGYRIKNYVPLWSKMLKIKVPRCRQGNFKPLLFRNGGMNSDEVILMMIQLWVEGSSYRDLAVLVKKLYGEHYSIGLFGQMISRIQSCVDEFHQRKIEFKYDCIFIDGLEISIKELPKRMTDENIVSKGKNASSLCVMGQRKEGKKVIKEMLDFRICSSENEKGYTSLLEDLRRRGLTSEKIGLIVHDGHQAINSAIKNVYSKERVLQQECLIHRKRSVVDKVKNKINKKLLNDEVWKVYSSKTEDEFKKLHKKVVRKWAAIEPEAIEQFKKINRRMLTKYQFDIDTHKDIHSNNAIERRFKEIRRRTKAMGIFETVKSADKLFFLIVEYLNQRAGSVPTNCQLVFTH